MSTAPTIAETVSHLLMEMNLPTAVHAMVPEYIEIKAYRVEQEVLTFSGSWSGVHGECDANVECVISTRHGRPAVTITITG